MCLNHPQCFHNRCRNIVLKDKGHPSYGWCQDFLQTGGDGRAGSCCKADQAIFNGWCMQVCSAVAACRALAWSSATPCLATGFPVHCPLAGVTWILEDANIGSDSSSIDAGSQPQESTVGGGL